LGWTLSAVTADMVADVVAAQLPTSQIVVPGFTSAGADSNLMVTSS
jgi:hypothetical protein